MTPSEIIARARIGIADTSSYPNTDGILDFNFIYQDLISEIITELDEDYFFDIGTSDLVQNQNEYTINDIGSPTAKKINQINKVFVKYDSTATYFTPVRRVAPNTLEKGRDWYMVNQPKTDPIYYVQDNSMWIFPVASQNVTGGLEIHAIYQPSDLTISSTAADIVIPPRFHQVIVQGIRRLILSSFKMINEENDAKIKYEEAKKDMIMKMRNRNQGVIEVGFPSSVFNYT